MKNIVFVCLCLLASCNVSTEQKTEQPYFSVSDSTKVEFSKGNLMYKQSENSFKFAEHQYDMVADGNLWYPENESQWIDLFAFWYIEETYNRAPIYDWRVLSSPEWKYLLGGRKNADSLKAVANINGINGLLLLPDNWNLRQKWQPMSYGVVSENCYSNHNNTFSIEEWERLEKHGAIFLPAAGVRVVCRYRGWQEHGPHIFFVNELGFYWSSSLDESADTTLYLYGLALRFGPHYAKMESRNDNEYYTIRLVRNL